MRKKFICYSCNTSFDKEDLLQNHIDSVHHVIYLPIQKEDLGRLQQFLYTGDRSLLTKTLVEVVDRYAKASAKKEFVNKESEVV